MPYKLNPSLFVEQGAEMLARRARAGWTSAREFKLLEPGACNHDAQPVA